MKSYNRLPDPSHAALSQRQDMCADTAPGIVRDETKLIAFYLPQFHRIRENSEWWGPGFTEWTNVVRGRPNFNGHYQPHIPRELGFYDLSHIEIMHEQAELARLYGIHGFCFHYYWFSGRRILERPLDNFLNSDIDINFCLCWANENWTRTWDGEAEKVLLGQKYAEGDDDRFIDSLIKVFSDRRYITVDGKPMLIVYRAKHIPDAPRWFTRWRAAAQRHGFPGLHIAAVDFYDITDPREVGADALVEFPPHKFNAPDSAPDAFPAIRNADFAGGILDYSKMIAQSALRPAPDFIFYRGIIPGWDNTARRQNNPTIVINTSPRLFGAWLRYLRIYTRRHSAGDSRRFIFLNAWNEWGEGCHLEPDLRWGLQYLEETYRSAFIDAAVIDPVSPGATDEARKAVLNEVARLTLSGDDGHGIPDDGTVKERAVALARLRPVGRIPRAISNALSRWPLVHKAAKSLYIFGRQFFH